MCNERCEAAVKRQHGQAQAGEVEKREESAGQLLQRLGDDAAKWAAEFRATAVRLGYSDMDEGWLIGWFANAIENSSDVRHCRKQAALSQQPEARGVVDEAVPRYVCLKAEGSRYAYVNDTQESRTVKRYDIFRRYGGMDGWTCATEHAASLNALTGERNG